MINNQIFAWGDFIDTPIAFKTVPSQKEATYQDTPDSVFTGDIKESFFTNEDKGSEVNISDVIGEEPKDLIYGKGYTA